MISTIEHGVEDTFGLSPGEVLWLREHHDDNRIAEDLTTLYERAAADPRDEDARSAFLAALVRFRDSDEYTGVLMKMFTA